MSDKPDLDDLSDDGGTDWLSLIALTVFAALAALIIAFVGAFATPVNAAELTGKARGEWIKALRSVDDTNCCAEADGEDVYWEASREAATGYKIFTKDGEWKRVPEGALITTPNRIGKALVWLNFTLDNGAVQAFRLTPEQREDGRTIVKVTVRCFLPGAAY